MKLLQRLQDGDDSALTELGATYQKGFVAWAGGLYHFQREVIQDFFVDALFDFNFLRL